MSILNSIHGGTLSSQNADNVAITGGLIGGDTAYQVEYTDTTVTFTTVQDAAPAMLTEFDWQPAENTAVVRFAQMGLLNHSTNNDITGVGHYGGVIGIGRKTGTGTDALAIGVEGRVGAIAGTVTLGAAFTATFDNNTESAGTITNGVGFYMADQAGAGTEDDHITNKYAFLNNWADGAIRTAGKVEIAKDIDFDATITAPGTTGGQTINKGGGRVNIAAGAGAAGITVTNNLVTANSLPFAQPSGLDATAFIPVAVVPGPGSFTVYMNANATAELPINWVIFN